VPAPILKSNGQVVQQFGVGGQGALVTKIERRGHDSRTEHALPESIYGNPGGQWVVWMEQPFGQPQSVFWIFFRIGENGFRGIGEDPVGRLVVYAPVQYVGGSNFLH